MTSFLCPDPGQLIETAGDDLSDPFRGPPIDRRAMLFGAAASAFLAPALFGAVEVEAASPPYPWAGRRLRRADGTWLWKKGAGADQWVSGAINGNSLLAAWGDGFGWSPSGRKAAIGVSAIGGSASGPRGSDLWRSDRDPLKPCAVIADHGPPLIFAVSDRDERRNSYLLRGSSNRRSYSMLRTPVLTKSRHGLVVVGTVDPRPGSGGGKIGLYFSTDGNLRMEPLYRGPHNRSIYYASASRSGITNPDSWAWYGGAPWKVGRRARPVFRDRVGNGKHFLVSWCPALSSYVAVKTQRRTGLGIFSSSTPVGPWRTLWYGDLTTNGYIFTGKAIGMWSTGSTVAVMWSGGPDQEASRNYDAVYLTRFRLA